MSGSLMAPAHAGARIENHPCSPIGETACADFSSGDQKPDGFLLMLEQGKIFEEKQPQETAAVLQDMIQDIAPKKMYNQFRDLGPERMKEEDTAFVFEGRNVVCHVDEERGISFPKAGDLLAAGASREHFRYLFSIDERPFWLFASFEENSDARAVLAALNAGKAGSEEDHAAAESGAGNSNGIVDFRKAGNLNETEERKQNLFSPEPLRVLRRTQPQVECYAGETAYHLYVWYRDNAFCGRCGERMEYSGKERAMICPACGNVVYPKIAPAVIVGILNPAKDQIVMTRYAGREYKGHALVAGFCEIGETAEDTVRREVLEEVGLHVRDIRYYKSQPWGFDSNLLFGYYCTADETEPIHMDDGELARAVWVPREEIGEEPRNLSLTAEMIMNFRDGKV